MMRAVLALTVSAATFWFSMAALALSYDEAVSGDLPQGSFTTPPSVVFSLEVGTNEISGTQTLFDSDSDAFGLIVAPGNQIVSASMSISNLGAGVSSVVVSLHEGTPGSIDPVTLVGSWQVGPSAPVDSFGNFPFGPENYYIFCCAGSGSATNASFDYVFGFTVIPEPSTALLIASGLVALAARRRAGAR